MARFREIALLVEASEGGRRRRDLDDGSGPSDGTPSTTDTTLSLAGRSWKLKTFPIATGSRDDSDDSDDSDDDDDAASSRARPPPPPFACVSYVWGPGRAPNPLHASQLMSDRTLASLDAAVRTSPRDLHAYWIDAFSVPVGQPSKSLCLESLGYIFNLAASVVAVLSPAMAPALEQMARSDRVDDRTLLAFEAEDWIASVWTYQEVVNSQDLQIASRDPASAASVDGSHFLNCIGYSLSLHKKAHGLDSLGVRRDLPALDAFEDLVADWMISGYGERSALQVMSNLDRRTSAQPRNYYHSLLGSVCTEPSRREAGDDLAQLAAKVMRACEEKDDFSFVYCPVRRSDEPGSRWRPVAAGPLRSILPWHGFGSGQQARQDQSGTFLRNVVVAQRSDEICAEGRDTLMDWLKRTSQAPAEADISDWTDMQLTLLVFRCLTLMGFQGSDDFVLLADGFFFPEWAVKVGGGHEKMEEVLVATEVFWTFGAPGLLRFADAGEWHYVPGVFFGKLRKDRAEDVLLL